jgi:hypothetical protein
MLLLSLADVAKLRRTRRTVHGGYERNARQTPAMFIAS